MSKRKGELTSAGIDRGWPHQVALHAEICTDDQFHPLHELARSLGASPRGRHVTKIEPHGYQHTYNLFCFASQEAAQVFIDKAGGRHFNPDVDREKPKSRNLWTWREWGDRVERYGEIVARLERVRSYEPALDADIAWLLGIPNCVRFTRERGEVEAFFAGRIPKGAWEWWLTPAIDARVRQSEDDAWRHACENTTRPRDCPATALSLAFLRSCASQWI